ncbi:MAG: hypothetical protein QOH08_1665 [Chloroflexota bacterium]|nr:hypothetical protein [Chloroflexota bacterium]
MWDYEVDWVPPGLEVVERDDVLMWRRDGPTARARWNNRVSWVRTTHAAIESLIDEIFEFFDGRPLSWVVGPSSSPADVGRRLAGRGLVDTGDGDLLTAELPLGDLLRTAPDVRIEEVADAPLARIGMRLAQPDSTDEEIESMVRERLAYLRHPRRRGGFLVAWIGDVPVAHAGYRYSGDGRTVYLSGAATEEQWRGRGVYQSLVRYRLDAAVRRGCRYAAIRARRDTSLPILTKRGFIDHGHLPIYSRDL